MLELAVFEDLGELRDAVLILAGIAASVVVGVALLFVLKFSLMAYRIVRRLERFHDQRIVGKVAAADARLAAWLEQDRWSARGILELLQLAAQRVQERRQPPPKKRRLFGLLPPA
jgi:adenylosuccinate lyase